MLHKAQPSEGCWNVPRQGQEQERGVSFANNTICKNFCEQRQLLMGSKTALEERVCLRQLSWVRNRNLEPGNQLKVYTGLILSVSNSKHKYHVACSILTQYISAWNKYLSLLFYKKIQESKQKSAGQMWLTYWTELSVERSTVAAWTLL